MTVRPLPRLQFVCSPHTHTPTPPKIFLDGAFASTPVFRRRPSIIRVSPRARSPWTEQYAVPGGTVVFNPVPSDSAFNAYVHDNDWAQASLKSYSIPPYVCTTEAIREDYLLETAGENQVFVGMVLAQQ